jgi:hypothetical protein
MYCTSYGAAATAVVEPERPTIRRSLPSAARSEEPMQLAPPPAPLLLLVLPLEAGAPVPLPLLEVGAPPPAPVLDEADGEEEPPVAPLLPEAAPEPLFPPPQLAAAQSKSDPRASTRCVSVVMSARIERSVPLEQPDAGSGGQAESSRAARGGWR